MNRPNRLNQTKKTLASEQIQMIVFKLEETEFAVPITQAIRIVRLSSITRVPRAPDFLEGVINVEGEVTPVVDLKKRFSLSRTPYGSKARIIIIETEAQQVGLMVDLVCEILTLPAEAIEPPPNMIADINGVYLTGVAQLDNRLLVILDLANVLTLKEIDSLEEFAPDNATLNGEML